MSKESIGLFVGLAALIYFIGPWSGTGLEEGGSALTITPSNFEAEVILSSQPVLAYFWAPW